MKEHFRFYLPLIRPMLFGLLHGDRTAVKRTYFLLRLQKEFGLVEIDRSGKESHVDRYLVPPSPHA